RGLVVRDPESLFWCFRRSFLRLCGVRIVHTACVRMLLGRVILGGRRVPRLCRCGGGVRIRPAPYVSATRFACGSLRLPFGRVAVDPFLPLLYLLRCEL